MLNIEDLKKQFNEIRATLGVKELQEWLDFAEQKELEDKLAQGEAVSLFCSISIITIEEKEITIKGTSSVNSIDEYAIAA